MQEKSLTEYFKSDHERLDGLFSRFQSSQAGDPAAAREAFRDFKYGLERHISWEEDILFPFFERATGLTGSGPTAVMRHDHERLRGILRDIHLKVRSARPDTAGDAAALTSLLSEHNHKEEAVLYPLLDDMATEKDRQEMFAKMQEYPESRPCCCGDSA